MTGRRLKVRVIFMLCMMFLLITSIENCVLAEDAEFHLDIDSLNLEEGVSTNLVFTITNANKCKNLKVYGLENFRILAEGNLSSTKIINGVKTTQVEFRYTIMPEKAGEFSIQGSVEYNGNTIETNVLDVNVSKPNTVFSSDNQDIFIKTILSEDELYMGQKVALLYELYYRENYKIGYCNFTDTIDIDNFIVDKVDPLDYNFVYINGNEYVKQEIDKRYLTTMKTGEVTIPSYNFQAQMYDRVRKQHNLKTEEKKLIIKPLPENDKPVNFSGLVGKLNVESEYSKNQVEYGDSLTLNVTLSGSCNLKMLDKLVEEDLPGLSVYETPKDTKESIVNDKYNSEKKFEIILVPEKTGEIVIEPMYISYFDTESKTYNKVEIQGTTITVTGEIVTDDKNVSINEENTSVEKVIIDQIDYNINEEGYITVKLNRTILFIVLGVLIILVLVVVALLYIRAHDKKTDKNLNNIYKKLKNTKDENEIYNLLNDMIKYKYKISMKANSKEFIQNIIDNPDVSNAIVEVINYMEDNRSDKKDTSYLKDKIKEIYNRIK